MPPDIKDLKRARKALWQRYQSTYDPKHSPLTEDLSGFKNDGEREAYLLSRFPATYGACFSVFERFFEHDALQKWSKEAFTENLTLLDLGCGPGTASLAFCDVLRDQDYSHPSTITCIDQDEFMLHQSQENLRERCDHLILTKNTLIDPKEGSKEFSPADIVFMSYMLAEVPLQHEEDVLKKAFLAANKALIILSPGTSALFPRFLKWRQHLINLGGFIVAPCPQMTKCPLDPSLHPHNQYPRWCHFKARISRTRDMKLLKDASMSFEDEPYTYLIVLKKPLSVAPFTRVISPPQKRKGHMHVEVCTGKEIITKTYSSRMDNYRALKHAKWGDAINV